jgi:hypothetical protein
LAESYKWFFLAARDGDQDAAQKRDAIASDRPGGARRRPRRGRELESDPAARGCHHRKGRLGPAAESAAAGKAEAAVGESGPA